MKSFNEFLLHILGSFIRFFTGFNNVCLHRIKLIFVSSYPQISDSLLINADQVDIYLYVSQNKFKI